MEGCVFGEDGETGVSVLCLFFILWVFRGLTTCKGGDSDFSCEAQAFVNWAYSTSHLTDPNPI